MAVGKGLTPMTPMEPINTDKTTEEDSTPVDTAVVFDPDVAGVFSNSQSVNEARRLLIHVAKRALNFQKAS
jgi:hypothetical protein